MSIASLNCVFINQCLSFGLSIEEYYNESRTGDFDLGLD